MGTPHTRRALAVRAAAAAAASVVVLAGCGSGLGSESAGEGETEGPIKLGMLAPFSGTESAFGDYMKNGATMAVDEINEAGGVDGRDLELVTEDDACDATTAVAGANKLVSEGIAASVGGYCSGSTLPTLPIFGDANLPMVIPAANSNALVGADQSNVFLINGTGTQQAQAAVAYAQKIDAQKVGVINDTTDYSADLAKSFVKQAEEAGIEILFDDSVNPKEKDYAAEANTIAKSGADLVYWTGYYQEGGLINRQSQDAGYDEVFMVADGSVDATFAEISGADYTDNVVATFTQTPDMLEGAEDWIADYKDQFGADPGPYSTQSYDAVRVMAEGMKNAGSTDGDAVIEALEGLDGFEIFSGPLTFTPEHTLSEGGFAILEINDEGVFVLKDDLKN